MVLVLLENLVVLEEVVEMVVLLLLELEDQETVHPYLLLKEEMVVMVKMRLLNKELVEVVEQSMKV